MNIKIISVGKIKEKYLVEGIKEYSKRLSKYTKLELIEVKDEQAPDHLSEKDIDIIKDIEGKRILSKLKDEYVIALAIEGKQLSSTDLANKMNDIGTYHSSNLCFIIGGSLGLSKNVLDRAKFKLSFSNMTFPHQLMKLILLEQIYRSFRINNNEPYHK
ncbi:23S rRNA (pseudouridine(1915)-N(3))-methyltransferase RlmH [Candidatus Izemoplasma sp. B36]|uniref:23S rRNA (pseudouridine(1915)-N(3))-methyltransferase RlmH n=1 Tax=Candidatus Izemoplasma sp. B36 TaxID=3242468 RepID=UPI0035577C2E